MLDVNVVAALFAVDPCGLGGVALRAPAGQPRDDWLALLKGLLPADTPYRRIPLNINDAALLGGLDLGATLNAGRPIAQQGVLAHADGGVVLLAMAERLPLATAARIAAVLDTQSVAIERDGLALKLPARLGVVALDEGIDDEQVPAALLDRLAFLMPLAPNAPSDSGGGLSGEAADWQAKDIAFARTLLPRISVPDDAVQALCAAAWALGVHSLRAPIFAVRVARCAAALDGLLEVNGEHIALAARLVLAPRATQLPPASDQADDQPNDQQSKEQEQQSEEQSEEDFEEQKADQPEPPAATEPPISSGQALADSVLDAVQAAIPAGLLAALRIGQAAKARTQAAGRSGAAQKSQTRGRPLGARRGEPSAGARLNILETLRAAAPWQKLRQREALQLTGKSYKRIHVRREDFHVTRFKQRSQTTTVFVVDASGSSALNRLAEAKGAVELLLADCYVRRDHVAVLAFRGKTAELLLPPTRSLARAKRSLAGLPGGGGTPLATAIDAARELTEQIRRRGETPIVVLLTDGRGNIARDGSPGRAKAAVDSAAAARQLRQAGITALLLDTSAQPDAAAQALANELGAAYVPLPHAGAQAVSRVVQLACAAAR